MTEAPARKARPAGALMSDEGWAERACLTGRRIVTRDWRPDKVKVDDGGPTLTTSSPRALLREYRAAALAVMAWADDVVFDPAIWLIRPSRHVHQPWRTLAYHLAAVHLGARKACVARAACVSERAINWACWRIERDRDDEAVDAALCDLEAQAGVMMLRCLAAEGASLSGLTPIEANNPPWLSALDAAMIDELGIDELGARLA
jgi:hypothetical protein